MPSTLANSECPICLDRLKDPVSTPCGHLCCKDCLDTHIQGSEDPYQSTCPTCRLEFSIVSPNTAHIPDKYKPFICPSVRRIYIPGGDDSPENDAVKQEMDGLYARVASLLRDKELLLNRAERALEALAQHREGERAARAQVRASRQEIEQLRQETVVLRHDVALGTARELKFQEELSQHHAEANAVKKKYEELRTRYCALKSKTAEAINVIKRKSSAFDSSISSSTSVSVSLDELPGRERIEIVNNRPVLRFPKRPRLGTARFDPTHPQPVNNHGSMTSRDPSGVSEEPFPPLDASSQSRPSPSFPPFPPMYAADDYSWLSSSIEQSSNELSGPSNSACNLTRGSSSPRLHCISQRPEDFARLNFIRVDRQPLRPSDQSTWN